MCARPTYPKLIPPMFEPALDALLQHFTEVHFVNNSLVVPTGMDDIGLSFPRHEAGDPDPTAGYILVDWMGYPWLDEVGMPLDEAINMLLDRVEHPKPGSSIADTADRITISLYYAMESKTLGDGWPDQRLAARAFARKAELILKSCVDFSRFGIRTVARVTVDIDPLFSAEVDVTVLVPRHLIIHGYDDEYLVQKVRSRLPSMSTLITQFWMRNLGER